MRGPVVYLDSSAMVKRYVLEPNSDRVRKLYLRAYSGEVTLSYSVWNIGEVLGVFDRARRMGRLDDDGYRVARRRFLLETRRMVRTASAVVLPLKVEILKDCWRLIERHHIYEADALQIVSAKHVNAAEFLTGDEKLHEVALAEGLNSAYLG